MIALLDNGQDLDECAKEIGGEVGQLLTPLTRYLLRDPGKPWAIDNGGYSGFLRARYIAMLKREEHHKENCLFVSVPDVVGSARRTLEVFEYWAPRLQGWPLALVCQDGQEYLPIPWEDIAAVFIGGTTNWKCGPHAVHIIKAAQLLGKHTHVGRVNEPSRWKHFDELGVDSADGSGIARYTAICARPLPAATTRKTSSYELHPRRRLCRRHGDSQHIGVVARPLVVAG